VSPVAILFLAPVLVYVATKIISRATAIKFLQSAVPVFAKVELQSQILILLNFNG
jgi:hypothetical protein